MSYAADHANAFAYIAEIGDNVSFTYSRRIPTGGNPSRSAVARFVFDGVARQLGEGSEEFEGFRQKSSVVLLFVSVVYGELPPLGSKVEWGRKVYTVNQIRHLAPDGIPITSPIGLIG